DNSLDPDRSNVLGQRQGRQLAFLFPTARQHLAVSSINADGNATRAKQAQCLVQTFGSLYCQRANHYSCHAQLNYLCNIHETSQPTAKLQRNSYPGNNFAKYLSISRIRIGERAIQIDQMNHLCATGLVAPGNFARIAVVDCRVVFPALSKAHTTTIAEINGR